MIIDRKVTLYRFDTQGRKQLTRIVFEVQTKVSVFTEEFVWLKVEDPTQHEMDRIVTKLVKPRLQEQFPYYPLNLLLNDLKRDYAFQLEERRRQGVSA